MKANAASRPYLAVVLTRFQSLHLALLKRVSRTDARGRTLAAMTSVLSPLPPSRESLTINDTSPLQVAMESQDIGFMASPLLEEYTRAAWRGGAFVAQSACNDLHSVSLLSPMFGWR